MADPTEGIHPAEDGQECECCHYPALIMVTGRVVSPIRLGDGQTTKTLCEVCYNTMAGTWHDYMSKNITQLDMARHICFVGNMIMDAIKGLKP